MSWADKFNKVNNKQSAQTGFSPSDQGAFTQEVNRAAPGLLDTPVLGGILKPILSGEEMLAQVGKTGLDTVTGQNVPETGFISPKTAQALGAAGQKNAPLGGALKEGVGTGLGAGLAVDSLIGGPGMIKGGISKGVGAATNLKDAIPSLMSGAKGWENIINSVSGAEKLDKAKILSRALGEAKGEVAGVRGEVQRILDQEFPQSTAKAVATPGKDAGTAYEGSGIDPILAAQKAASFGKAAGENFFQSGVGSDTQKAYGIISKAIKTELSNVAPKYEGANKLYGQGATLRSAAPTIAKSVLGKAGLPAAGLGVGGFLYELLNGRGQSNQ